MAKLKAGSAQSNDAFADSLAAAIEEAMKMEWSAVNDGESMPTSANGDKDRRMLFAAIAQGVLSYLHAHSSDIETNVANDTSSGHAHRLKFQWERKRPGD